MNRRTLRSLSVGMAILLVFSMAGCSTTPASPESTALEPYRIGFMAAITGGASFLGLPERDAAVMLQAQLDAQGGIVGPDGVRRPVRIVIYDTEGNGDVAVTVARKLINDDSVIAIVGTTVSPTSMVILPLVQEAEVPLVSMASSSAIVEPVEERHWVFKTAQSNEHTAPLQVAYAQAIGIQRIANYYVHNAYGEDGALAIREAAREAGLEIVLEETFDATDTDMTAQLTKLRASGAEALLVTAIPPAAAILTRQFRELGLEMPLIHNHGIGMRSFIDLSGPEIAEGVVFPMGKLVAAEALDDGDPQKDVLVRFIAEYEAAGGSPGLPFAGYAWDGINLVLRALETLPPGLSLAEQRAHVRESIESTQRYVGISGVFSMSTSDHVGLSPSEMVLVRITDGEWEYYPPERW